MPLRVSQRRAFGGVSPRASVVLRKFMGLRGHRHGALMLTEGEGSRPGSHTWMETVSSTTFHPQL